MIDTLDINPCTIEDAHRTIGELLARLIRVQEIAIDRGTKLIALNEERLGGASKRDPLEAFDGGRLG